MNSVQRWLVILLLVGGVGCSASINRKAMESELGDGPPVYDDQDIERIENIDPQAQYPLRIGVAPPYQRYGRNRWTAEERNVISSWEKTLQQTDAVEQVFVLPNMLVQGNVRSGDHDSYLKRIRVAAARHNANTVLILHTVSETDTYANPVSILDLTLVGNWIFPGHNKKTVTMMEGVLINTRNLFLYGSGYADGEETAVKPRVFIAGAETRQNARLQALKKFGSSFQKIVKHVQNKRPSAPGTNEPEKAPSSSDTR